MNISLFRYAAFTYAMAQHLETLNSALLDTFVGPNGFQSHFTHMRKKIKITEPIDVQHTVHISSDLKWSFDDDVSPESIFTKIRDIGKGGYGNVIELIHTPSQTLLAGKTINSDLISANSRKALQREIDLMREIACPYTIHYYGTILFNKQLTILMEFCPQGSLRDLIDITDRVLNENQIAFVMHDLLSALKVLHNEHHIVHRDVKAANILLANNGFCRVTDFGVSRKFASDKTFSTRAVVGTPYWMAPEVINEDKHSFPADVWSTASTAYELAEGAPPYCDLPPTRAMVQIAKKGFPKLHSNHFSLEFVNFISKCTSFLPSERATVDELLNHPFIKRIDKLDRMTTLKNLLTTNMCFEKLLEMDNDTSNSSESFEILTKSFIATSRKTFRKK